MTSLFLGGAHFWRGGRHDLALLCVLLGLLAWSRQAWIRHVLRLALPLLAGRWIWTAGQIAQLRLMTGEPWQRMAIILLGVAAFSVVSALLLTTRAGKKRYFRQHEASIVQTAAFVLICILLGAVHHFHPQALLLNRFPPGWGGIQVFLCAAWGAWVAGKLLDRAESAKIRMRVWRLFSCVFFVQLALGLAGYTRFLMTGTPHIPVPGLIIASPLYRGEGFFMPTLFGISVLLCGAAWQPSLLLRRLGRHSSAAATGRSPARLVRLDTPCRPCRRDRRSVAAARDGHFGGNCRALGNRAGAALPSSELVRQPQNRTGGILPRRLPFGHASRLVGQAFSLADTLERALHPVPQMRAPVPVRRTYETRS